MSAWRCKAIEQFPSLHRFLTHHSPAARLTTYGLAYELLQMVRYEPTASDSETLQRIFEYAEWALRQRASEIRNPISVSFYEHLFDRREDWERVIPYLSPYAIRNNWSLWEARSASLVDFEELQHVLAQYGKTLEHVMLQAP